jgi:uncharacterized protein YndB with AHSA1/START domain
MQSLRNNTMRLSDCPGVEVEIFIAASPQRVWELVVDLQLMEQWSPEYQGGEWLDRATGPMVGARFKGHNKRHERAWESVSTVIEATPGRTIAWAVGDPKNPEAVWRFNLAAQSTGTRVRQYAGACACPRRGTQSRIQPTFPEVFSLVQS